MNLFSFTAHFDSKEAYRNHFKEERDKIGVVCILTPELTTTTFR